MVKTLKQQAEDDLPGYELGITLGSGGFGEVVVGTNIVSGIKYAIKIIPATIDPEDRKMYEQEVKIMHDLSGSSKYLVELVGSKVRLSNWYLIIELALGGELGQGSTYKHREERAKSIVRDITTGLSTMHGMGIIHSDIKMSNILLKTSDENSVAMIADFGLSKYVKDADDTAGGTPGYMAPELKWPGHIAGTEIDIWSLGILVWELFFTRRIQIELATTAGTAATIKNFPVNKISLDAERFIKDCLNGDPKTRMTALEALDHPWFKNSTPTSAAVQILAASPAVAAVPDLAAAPARRKARVREAAPAAKRQKPNRGLCDKKIRNCSYI